MPSPFAKYLNTKVKAPKLKLLPFFHSVEALRAGNIFADGSLKLRTCPVFKEPLVYLFYGRPAYKVGFDKGSRGQGDLFYCPVVFVLKPNNIPLSPIKRIYPFDTGAFEDKYRDLVPPEFSFERFFLGTSNVMTKKLIKFFFGSNEDYFRGKTCLQKNAVEWNQMEARSYLNILHMVGTSSFDDRAYTAEYQLGSDVDLAANILAVAMPEEALDAPDIYDLVINKWKATPLKYMTYHCGNISTFHGALFSTIHEFLKKRKYLKR
ncbi:MAG: hypothetical protein FVQ85_00480 [Planctomycetes bacterium]|nr:hypothetical protein [Planctomycetota bacterium]